MQRLNSKNSNSMKSDERELSNSEKGMLVRSMDEYAFYKEMFSQLIDIVDALLT